MFSLLTPSKKNQKERIKKSFFIILFLGILIYFVYLVLYFFFTFLIKKEKKRDRKERKGKQAKKGFSQIRKIPSNFVQDVIFCKYFFNLN